MFLHSVHSNLIMLSWDIVFVINLHDGTILAVLAEFAIRIPFIYQYPAIPTFSVLLNTAKYVNNFLYRRRINASVKSSLHQ